MANQPAPADLPLWCMMETPRGILHAEAIADQAGVDCLVMGTSDLAKDLLGRKPGETVSLSGESWTIERIEPLR